MSKENIMLVCQPYSDLTDLFAFLVLATEPKINITSVVVGPNGERRAKAIEAFCRMKELDLPNIIAYNLGPADENEGKLIIGNSFDDVALQNTKVVDCSNGWSELQEEVIFNLNHPFKVSMIILSAVPFFEFKVEPNDDNERMMQNDLKRMISQKVKAIYVKESHVTKSFKRKKNATKEKIKSIFDVKAAKLYIMKPEYTEALRLRRSHSDEVSFSLQKLFDKSKDQNFGFIPISFKTLYKNSMSVLWRTNQDMFKKYFNRKNDSNDGAFEMGKESDLEVYVARNDPADPLVMLDSTYLVDFVIRNLSGEDVTNEVAENYKEKSNTFPKGQWNKIGIQAVEDMLVGKIRSAMWAEEK